MLQFLPNARTLSRLLLAAPLGYFIMQHAYEWALVTGLVAGVTDALDGFAARRLNALSRLGAALDPIADKVLITVAFICFASTGLIPWYLALVVISRDVIILLGIGLVFYLLAVVFFQRRKLTVGAWPWQSGRVEG